MNTNIVVLLLGLAVILPLVILMAMHLQRARKLYRERNPDQETPPILKLVVALALGTAWAISCLVLPITSAWQFILGHTALKYSLLLTYSANRHVLTSKPHHLKRSPLLIITTVLAALATALGYLSRDNLAHPFVGHPFTPTGLYVLYYTVVTGSLLFLFSLILNLYWQSLHQSEDLTYQARRVVGFLSVLCGLIAVAVVEASIILTAVYGTTYHAYLTIVFYFLLPWGTLFPVAQAVPQPIVVKAVQPLERYRTRRREESLRYLHQKMVQIVPGEQLPGDELDLVDAITEISGARRVIWTQEAHGAVVTAAEEAKYLFDLLQQKKVIERAGKYSPPQTSDLDIIKHNLAVAKYLHKLEARSAASRRLVYDTGH